MDLSAWLLRLTPPRPLVVAAPGGTAARLAVERAVRERGWRPAESPAEANLLVIAGAAGDALAPYLAQVWAQVPAPRVRVDVPADGDVAALLDAALRTLRDTAHQRNEATLAASRPAAEHTEHAGHTDHAGHHDHGGHHDHAGHDMGDMDMPGGVPMADRAPDRDGLKLDELHVPLGPALPWWPAGLIVHTRLQGDVVQGATVELLAPAPHSPWTGPARARRLDSCARLLALAGWPDAAVTAQRLRDDVLTGADRAPAVRRWTKRVGRSRTLRWLLTGIGSTSDAPDALAGDALDRLRRWLDALAGADAPLPGPDTTQWTVDHLPALLTGAELATARLVVASLDPDLDLLVRHGARHG